MNIKFIKEFIVAMCGMESEEKKTVIIVAMILTFIGISVIGGGAILPIYEVWRKELAGKALLKEAEWSRQIEITEAMAKKEAAVALAAAEVERAKGVAKANKIIGESLKKNESYLRYLWIQGLNDGSSEVIYVPTEANLPILEAGKR